jgi:mRNA interferase MazF
VQVRRGDLVIAELNPTKGSEQQGTDRPCVIIQNDVGNQFSPTTIIAPFTKEYDPSDIYPFEVEVLSSNTALNHDSVADLSQIRVVDVDKRVKKNIGSAPDTELAKIDAALKESLGL